MEVKRPLFVPAWGVVGQIDFTGYYCAHLSHLHKVGAACAGPRDSVNPGPVDKFATRDINITLWYVAMFVTECFEIGAAGGLSRTFATYYS